MQSAQAMMLPRYFDSESIIHSTNELIDMKDKAGVIC